jgi:hypothetical protein
MSHNTTPLLLTLLAALLATGCAGNHSNRVLAPETADCRAQAGETSSSLPQQRSTTTPEEVAGLDYAVLLVSQLRFAEAEPILQPLVVTFAALPDRAHAAEAMFWLAYCAEKTARNDDALGLYSKLIYQYPETASAKMAQRRILAIQPNP